MVNVELECVMAHDMTVDTTLDGDEPHARPIRIRMRWESTFLLETKRKCALCCQILISSFLVFDATFDKLSNVNWAVSYIFSL